MLTGQDPPFKEALNWLQFAYTADRVGAYVAPESTVLVQSAIAEGDELFPACQKHLQRLYPEVYIPVVRPAEVSLGWAPAHRDLHLGEDVLVLDRVNLSINSFSELGAYAGGF